VGVVGADTGAGWDGTKRRLVGEEASDEGADEGDGVAEGTCNFVGVVGVDRADDTTGGGVEAILALCGVEESVGVVGAERESGAGDAGCTLTTGAGEGEGAFVGEGERARAGADVDTEARAEAGCGGMSNGEVAGAGNEARADNGEGVTERVSTVVVLVVVVVVEF